MKKQNIETQLLAYKTDFEDENQYIIQVQSFLEHNDDFYQRSNLKGHLTGSAWVVSEDRKQVLLIHHKKLNMWIQPGGHADDSDENLVETARREAIEECGLKELNWFKKLFLMSMCIKFPKRVVCSHIYIMT